MNGGLLSMLNFKANEPFPYFEGPLKTEEVEASIKQNLLTNQSRENCVFVFTCQFNMFLSSEILFLDHIFR